jgi:hypothetical protein
MDYTHIHIFHKPGRATSRPIASRPVHPWCLRPGQSIGALGFFVLFLGAAVVALNGILSLISRSNAEEATD